MVTGVPFLLVRRRAVRATLAFGWLWIVTFGVFQATSKSLAPYHTYFTVVGLGFLAGGVIDAAVAGWQGELAIPRPPLVAIVCKLLVSGCLLGVVVFQAGVLRESVVLTRYGQWAAAASIADLYVQELQQCVRDAPANRPIVLHNWPAALGSPDGTTIEQEQLVLATMFAPYSLGPALRLSGVRPDAVVIDSLSTTNLRDVPKRFIVTCSDQSGVWRVDVAYE